MIDDAKTRETNGTGGLSPVSQNGTGGPLGPTNPVVTGIGIAIIAAIVIGSFVWASQFPGMNTNTGAAPSETNPVALVHDSDGATYTMPLNEDATIDVSTSLGTNTIQVQNGEVFVAASDCDGHDCMRQGHLSAAQPTKQLICLPHKLWIEIRTSEGEGQLNPDAAANDGGHLDEGEIDEFAEGLDTSTR